VNRVFNRDAKSRRRSFRHFNFVICRVNPQLKFQEKSQKCILKLRKYSRIGDVKFQGGDGCRYLYL